MKVFSEEQKWYKGNLHTHTTVSDGKVSPEDVVAAYKNAGYSFICITDHRKYHEGSDSADFVILSGEEFNFEDKEKNTAYHVIGIDFDGHFENTNQTPPQTVIDEVLKRGGLAVMGHPAWSLMSHGDIAELHGLSGTEVFSTISHEYSGRGDSTSYADVLMTMGIRFFLLGVDDMHFFKRDFAKTFIMLTTDDFSQKGIRRALEKETFYASEGPLIKSLEFEKGHVKIETTPVRRIVFYSNSWYNGKRVVVPQEGDTLTCAEYDVTLKDKWIRIEGTDLNGKRFTTNYFDTSIPELVSQLQK